MPKGRSVAIRAAVMDVIVREAYDHVGAVRFEHRQVRGGKAQVDGLNGSGSCRIRYCSLQIEEDQVMV